MSIKSNRGATLVELMTSIAIFGIIAAAALGLLLYATNINSDITAEVIETNRVYQALDLIKTSAAESTYITVSDDGKTINTASGVFRLKNDSKTFIYAVGGGSEEIILLENIESLTFTPGSPQGDLKYLTFTLVTTEGNSYTTTISCKNG